MASQLGIYLIESGNKDGGQLAAVLKDKDLLSGFKRIEAEL